MVCELKITLGSKKNCVEIPCDGDVTFSYFRYRVISKKQCYAADEIPSSLNALYGNIRYSI